MKRFGWFKEDLKMALEKYFERVDSYFKKGKGFSVYNCSDPVFENIVNKIKGTNYRPQIIKTSDLLNTKNPQDITYPDIDSLVILQDLLIENFIKIIDNFINKLVFPIYFKHKPIFLLSRVDKSEYSLSIKSGLLHTDYDQIVNQLLLEQFDRLLEQVNLEFSSPNFLDTVSYNYLFTPIEECMYNALEKENFNFKPQAKIERFLVDFLVTVGNKKIIVECDGRDYHNPYHDRERDKELRKYGYEILHFTGSEILYNVEQCIQKIYYKASSNQIYQYPIDIDLDNSQKIALNHISGSMRVLAPAGSGKTKTLINRIVNLINTGIEPEKILALAFNKRAANEMSQRLEQKGVIASKKIGNEGVAVRTFHSFGYEIIKDSLKWSFNGNNENRNTRRLLRQSVEAYYQIPHRRNIDPLDMFLEALRKTKMELPHIDEVVIEENGKAIPFKNMFYRYIELQKQHNFFNFDDMIYLALRILLQDSLLRKKLQNRFEYVLIDEFQDLNKAQILLMQILALPQNNLFIVGDDDQMIYGWRGAEIFHILNFNKRYAESQDCTLSINYRSNKRIVYHSKWLIDNNVERVKKDIQPKLEKPAGIFEIKPLPSLWHQAIEITKWIKNQQAIQKAKWGDFAVLFRYNSYQYIIAMILDSEGIPHTPIDGERLFQTNVGKDVFSYLRILLYDGEATKDDFERILKRPNRSLSNDIINRISNYSEFVNSANMSGLQQWQRNKLQNVVDIVLKIKTQIPTALNSSSAIVTAISNEFGLRDFYQDQTKLAVELDDAGDDVLLDVIVNVARHLSKIDDFYAHIHKSLDSEGDSLKEGENQNRDKEVVLSTIHRTKGNEFKNVAYFNLAQNTKLREQTDIEEERRVTYVGVTRAIENILITAPENGFSHYLTELAFNPTFKNLSDVKLNNLLSQNKRSYNILSEKIAKLDSKIKSVIWKYPELRGENYQVRVPFLRNAAFWLRQKLVDSATHKIDTLESEKSRIIEEQLLPAQDSIEKIEIEIHHRKALNQTANNKSSSQYKSTG